MEYPDQVHQFFTICHLPGQLSPTGRVADYAQKSQVFAVDTIYDVKPWLGVGFKYAMRIGDLKTSKVEGEWFSSRADLLVLRADWHFIKEVGHPDRVENPARSRGAGCKIGRPGGCVSACRRGCENWRWATISPTTRMTLPICLIVAAGGSSTCSGRCDRYHSGLKRLDRANFALSVRSQRTDRPRTGARRSATGAGRGRRQRRRLCRR